MKSTFKDHHKAWKFHDHWEVTFQAVATPAAPTSTPVTTPIPLAVPPLGASRPAWLSSSGKSRKPGKPSVILQSGKDKSTEGEVYDINLEVSERELTAKLAAPRVTAPMARELSECLVDAVALPGKTGPATKGDDAVTTMSLSLEAFS
jgi:hypothetical protein